MTAALLVAAVDLEGAPLSCPAGRTFEPFTRRLAPARRPLSQAKAAIGAYERAVFLGSVNPLGWTVPPVPAPVREAESVNALNAAELDTPRGAEG